MVGGEVKVIIWVEEKPALWVRDGVRVDRIPGFPVQAVKTETIKIAVTAQQNFTTG